MSYFFLKNHIYKRGFTLLEILLVVGIIAILAGIVIVAINPGRQLATVRNTERKSDLKQIYNALQQYYIDHEEYPATVPTTLTEICDTGTATSTHSIDCTDLVDFSTLVPVYFVAVPTDPLGSLSLLDKFIPKVYAATNGTGYWVREEADHKIVLTAPQAELGIEIVLGITTGTSTESWACGDILTDERDAKTYTTSLIGTECWLSQNLNVGVRIPGAFVQGGSCDFIDKYCYDDDDANCDTYGGLYQWSQLMCGGEDPGATGICPTGWHIPTHNEFTALERAVCTSGTCVTDFPYDTITTGETGTNEGASLRNPAGVFKGLMGGFYNPIGSEFSQEGAISYYWSSLADGVQAWSRYFGSGFDTTNRYLDDKLLGLSVRCIKD